MMRNRTRFLLADIVLVFLLWTDDVQGRPAEAPAPPDYAEYESLVLRPLQRPDDGSFPNYRELDLQKAEQYKLFISRFPRSLLVVEAKLRIAEFYLRIEKPEVNGIMFALQLCKESATETARNEECLREADEKLNALGGIFDFVYRRMGIELLLELERDFGCVRRYALVDRDARRFRHTEEEVGGLVRYLLAGVSSQREDRARLYQEALREYTLEEGHRAAIEDYFIKMGIKKDPAAPRCRKEGE